MKEKELFLRLLSRLWYTRDTSGSKRSERLSWVNLRRTAANILGPLTHGRRSNIFRDNAITAPNYPH
jgi:hypothetical protein